MNKSVVEIANEFVPMSGVLLKAGIYVPDFPYGKSWKSLCPFGELYHLDGSTEKCMRYYQYTNSAYCFQGCGYLTPVNLYARLTGVSFKEAAEELLDKFNYVEETDESKWKRSLELRAELDSSYLSSALQTYCSRVSGSSWVYKQYDDSVLTALKKCFSILSLVDSSDKAVKWLNCSKDYMREVLASQ